jgi:ATP-dependent DNA helicase RecQ
MHTTALTRRKLYTIFKADAKLRHYLAVRTVPATLFELAQPQLKQTGLEVVNWFYEVQDWFTEFLLASPQTPDTVTLTDGFGLGIPFVALAISSLFEFLDAVAGVLDVDFSLPPRVEVSGLGCTHGNDSPFHRCVTVLKGNLPRASVVNANVVAAGRACVPPPAHSAGLVKFRENLSPHEINNKLEYITTNVFGYRDGTNPFQDRVFERIFRGRDVLGIAATGGGKSLCFWLPGLLKPGLTLVISPLRSLMRDQHLSLRRFGIASVDFINVDVDKVDQRRILDEAKLGYVRLLYISPERLRIKRFLKELDELQEFVPINFLAVDEAHCISEWGHDFRPSYLKLPMVRDMLKQRNPELQLTALTATAGQQVQADMLSILRLPRDEGDVVRDKSVDRRYFSYEMVTVHNGAEKSEAYRKILNERLHKALDKESLTSLLAEGAANADGQQSNEKSVGIVFCIYADPHGRNLIRDGTAHYLFETMEVLEKDRIFEELQGSPRRFRIDAFSTGRVRAYSSKPPTLCPHCHSYEYTTRNRRNRIAEDTEEQEDETRDDGALPSTSRTMKVCPNHPGEFDASEAVSPPDWETIIKSNQRTFKQSGLDILVATKGFGMGIDKSSVRFIIHTSLSSGLESWYQEAGRAGRDEKRAHIVLLTVPPNEPCRRALKSDSRPSCQSYQACPHGRQTLCDYGKQHMFIKRSYPGAESDATAALRILKKLLELREEQADGPIVVQSSHAYLSQQELAIYRLSVLGLVNDYKIAYRPNPRFDVDFDGLDVSVGAEGIAELGNKMQERLREYISHLRGIRSLTIQQWLDVVSQEYRPLGNNFDGVTALFDAAKLALFQCVYKHLLVLLDHTYKDVLKMRYDMLLNLLTVVMSDKCRRVEMLPNLGERYTPPGNNCGCCDNCCTNRAFSNDGRTPSESPSDQTRPEREEELERMVRHDEFDLPRLWQLAEEVADYPTQNFRWARGILEGAPNNLCALFLTRRFSPPDELGANSKRLLRTANERKLPLAAVEELYRTSSDEFKSDLLICLNEAYSTCDSADGWRFLVAEAAKPARHDNEMVGAMHECLGFFLMVDETLPNKVPSLKIKARQLEETFYA